MIFRRRLRDNGDAGAVEAARVRRHIQEVMASDAEHPAPRAPGAPAAVPDGTVAYAIGDVHGRADLLEDTLAWIATDAARRAARRRVIVTVGDYVDRGPDSRGVVERLAAGPPDGFELVCLKGNHEDFLTGFLETGSGLSLWAMNGGVPTLASYGVAGADDGDAAAVRSALARAVPAHHLAFLDGLGLMHREGDYCFVHAGVRPGVPLDAQDPHDLMWIRGEFLSSPEDFGAVVVHGHTITPVPDVQDNRIGIDTGAVMTGRLTCLVLEGAERSFRQTGAEGPEAWLPGTM